MPEGAERVSNVPLGSAGGGHIKLIFAGAEHDHKWSVDLGRAFPHTRSTPTGNRKPHPELDAEALSGDFDCGSIGRGNLTGNSTGKPAARAKRAQAGRQPVSYRSILTEGVEHISLSPRQW